MKDNFLIKLLVLFPVVKAVSIAVHHFVLPLSKTPSILHDKVLHR